MKRVAILIYKDGAMTVADIIGKLSTSKHITDGTALGNMMRRRFKNTGTVPFKRGYKRYYVTLWDLKDDTLLPDNELLLIDGKVSWSGHTVLCHRTDSRNSPQYCLEHCRKCLRGQGVD